MKLVKTVIAVTLALLVVNALALAQGEKKTPLLAFSTGAMPNDTNPGADGEPKLSLQDDKDLGGIGLKVVFTKGASWGMSRQNKDMRGYTAIKGTAVNPGDTPVSLDFVIKHAGTKAGDFGTRVDNTIVLKPGKNDLVIPLAGAANNDGSNPDFSSVKQWYFCSETAATVIFGDLSLVGEGPAAAPPRPAPAAAAPTVAPAPAPGLPGPAPVPANAPVIRITGKIGYMPVDLTITGLQAIVVGPGGLSAVPAPMPAGPPPAAPPAAPMVAAPRPPAAVTGDLPLLAFSKGAMPNDSNPEDAPPQLSLVEDPQLGATGLKVVFTAGSSAGMSRQKKDFRGYASLKFSAVNPGTAPVSLDLTIKHAGTATTGGNFPTRVDKTIVLKPGKNDIVIPLNELHNNDGSAPDFSEVRQWYFCAQQPCTVIFGDIVLAAK